MKRNEERASLKGLSRLGKRLGILEIFKRAAFPIESCFEAHLAIADVFKLSWTLHEIVIRLSKAGCAAYFL